MTESNANVTWLTQEAYDRLNAELTHLSGAGRADIVAKIEAAREEGDLKENGGYHAAKEEQGKMEARIRVLKQLLENAKVGEAPPDDDIVEPGMVVSILYPGDASPLTFLLGSREDSGATIEVYSAQSPLGKAINGKKVGDEATYALPNGKKMTVKVVGAKPYSG